MLIYSEQTNHMVDTSKFAIMLEGSDVIAHAGIHFMGENNPPFEERLTLASCSSKEVAAEIMLNITMAAKRGEAAFVIN